MSLRPVATAPPDTLRAPSARVLPLTSLGLVLAAASASPALGDDLTISDTQTSPVSTIQGDGTGPGSIVIEGGGSVELTTGVPVTINSDHSFSSVGGIALEQEEDATGILVDLTAEPQLDSGIVNNGLLSVVGPETDGPLANTPVENAGIRMVGSGTFAGNIDNGTAGSIEVGGNASTGVAIQNMIGDFSNSGSIGTTGIESTAVGVYGDLVGDIDNLGTLASNGRDGVGLFVGGSVTGTITHSGTIGTGRGAARDFDGTLIPEVRGRAGLWIAGSVSGGIQVTGNKVTESEEAELPFGDPALSVNDADISVIGSGQAIRVGPGGPGATLSDITLGVVGSGDNAFAILNQGLISTGSNEEGVSVEAVTIEGLVSGGTIYRATLNGGIRNDGGDFRTGTTDADAVGIRIGDYGTVPEISNSGEILALTNDSTEDVDGGIIGDLGGNATAIIVEEQGSLTAITNSGIIRADAAGSASDASAIIVRSGTLTSFTNSGEVLALIRDGATGTQTALDVRTSTSDIDFLNSGTITGDIYLGDGSDTFVSTGGTITGEISLAGGDDVVAISDSTILGSLLFTTGNKTASITNSTFNGGLVESGALIDLSVSNVDWTITASEAATLRTLDVDGDSILRIEVDGVNNRAGTISVAGTANLSDTTSIFPVLRSVITDQQRFTLVSAGQLFSDFTFDEASIAETSYMHTVALVLDPDDPNVILLDVARRTADDLGLGLNTGIYYEASSAALGTDSELFTNLASITDQTTFESAVAQFLPDTSSAVMQAAVNQQNFSHGATTRRLDRVPALGFYKDRPTIWLQTLGNYVKQKAKGERPGYTSWAGSVAIGTDRQINQITRAGVAFTQVWSFPDELTSFDKPTEYSSSQVSGYFRMGNSYRHLQGSAAVGYNTFNSERRIVLDSVDRTALGDWNGYEFNTGLRLALGRKQGSFSFIPTATLNYLYMHQGSYVETGGGGGLNLDVDSDNRDSLRGSLGLGGRYEWVLEDESILKLEGRTSYTREFMSGTSTLDLAFAAGGTPFSLETAPLTQDVLSLGLSLFYMNDHATISFDYDGEKASGYTGHTGAVTVRFRF